MEIENYVNEFKASKDEFKDLSQIYGELQECSLHRYEINTRISQLYPSFKVSKKTRNIIRGIFLLLILMMFIAEIKDNSFNYAFQNTVFTFIFLCIPYLIIMVIIKIGLFIKKKSFRLDMVSQEKLNDYNSKLKAINNIEQIQQKNLNVINYPVNYRDMDVMKQILDYHNSRRATTLKESINLYETEKRHEEMLEKQEELKNSIDAQMEQYETVNNNAKKAKRASRFGAATSIIGFISNVDKNWRE